MPALPSLRTPPLLLWCRRQGLGRTLTSNQPGSILTIRPELGGPVSLDSGGSVAHDLDDMICGEVTLCMVCFMYVAHQDRWIGISLRNLTGDWPRRVEERFPGGNGGLKPSILKGFNQLNNPSTFVAKYSPAISNFWLPRIMLTWSDARTLLLARAPSPKSQVRSLCFIAVMVHSTVMPKPAVLRRVVTVNAY